MRSLLYVLLIAAGALGLWAFGGLDEDEASREDVAPVDGPTVAAPLRVHVVDTNGVPVFRARVRFGADGVDPTDRKNRVRTDAEGWAKTPPLAGRVHLFAGAPGRAAVRHTVEGDGPAPGVVVVKLRDASTLEGRVVDSKGVCVEGAVVRLVHEPPAEEAYGDLDWAATLETTSRDDGTFVIEDVPTRMLFDLEVRADGFRPFRVRIGVPATPLDVRIERAE